MDEHAILVLDEGTTSTRAMLFSPSGKPLGSAQRDLTQHYPAPGHVEHDAAEIWDRSLACARAMVEKAGGADRIACIGVTNQRETVVAWDRNTGEPLAPALVWQDRRTAGFCQELREAGHEGEVQRRTGLLIDPYFSATKMRWLLDRSPAVRGAADSGTLALGTVESWLVFKLTSGAFVTDASNASRTLLLPLDASGFDAGLCDMFGIPRDALAQVTDNMGDLGRTDPELFGGAIAITGLIGDQQGATIGQGCLTVGDVKATYGTGAFILATQGATPPSSDNRLLSTVLYQQAGTRTYALEGSMFVAGSLIQWLRDSLGMLDTAAETEELARSLDDSGGVTIIPALAGLGAPHWQPQARGLIAGLSFATDRAHIARAALEAMAHQTHDLAGAFAADGAQWRSLKVDGGMSANDWMVQDIANMLDLKVERPRFVETTALGTAMLAATGAKLFASLDDAARTMRGSVRQFAPGMDDDLRQLRLDRWSRALHAV